MTVIRSALLSTLVSLLAGCALSATNDTPDAPYPPATVRHEELQSGFVSTWSGWGASGATVADALRVALFPVADNYDASTIGCTQWNYPDPTEKYIVCNFTTHYWFQTIQHTAWLHGKVATGSYFWNSDVFQVDGTSWGSVVWDNTQQINEPIGGGWVRLHRNTYRFSWAPGVDQIGDVELGPVPPPPQPGRPATPRQRRASLSGY